ncbi:hypothetical protein U9M48_014642 [Paspalum notatum var. saurae]|uniref:Carboxypeptidase n=1 Tax=Paspalum notatum var. saurae TaxID=547442 RepID=A0AAQ3WL27_PASNO
MGSCADRTAHLADLFARIDAISVPPPSSTSVPAACPSDPCAELRESIKEILARRDTIIVTPPATERTAAPAPIIEVPPSSGPSVPVVGSSPPRAARPLSPTAGVLLPAVARPSLPAALHQLSCWRPTGRSLTVCASATAPRRPLSGGAALRVRWHRGRGLCFSTAPSARFSEYKGRAFYISGESYAGHYVPQLAATIISHNLYNNRTIVNLQGILVGNPYLDLYKNLKGRYEYLWSHGVLSDELLANITYHCSFNSSDNDLCSDLYKWYDYGPIDPYNIYAPICIDEPDGSYHSSSYLPGYNACDYYPTVTYLNDPVVQEAFHARKTEWSGCSDLITSWKDAPDSMAPTLQWLIKQGLPIWLFSGDFDAVCPLPATRYSIQDLNLLVTTPWRPWTAKEEVGGYVQQYTGGFTFISVRAAGHMVPSYQPERALILLHSFLKGVLPPYVQEHPDPSPAPAILASARAITAPGPRPALTSADRTCWPCPRLLGPVSMRECRSPRIRPRLPTQAHTA